MDKETLRMAGEAAFGPTWRAELARRLGVNDRAFRYWISGKYCPSVNSDDLKKVLRERIKEIEKVIQELD